MFRLILTPQYDSDNTRPTEVAISEDDDGRIIVELDNRKLVFAKHDWSKIETVFPST